MSETQQKIMEINKSRDVFRKASPKLTDAFKTLRAEACNDQGVLDYKTKELIAVAVAVARKCEPCILSHLDVALKSGITREELVEALNISILLCGGPGFAYASSTLKSYDELLQADSAHSVVSP